MNSSKSYSVVLPVFNESKTIGKFIRQLQDTNLFQEIICVDNNSTDDSKKIIFKNNATYLSETKQGFGAAVKKGLDYSKTTYVFICEPDGSFDVNDLYFFLEKNKKYENVFGSRTSELKIFYLKYGNYIFAKMLSFLFQGPKLTDVGCSFRLIKKSTYNLFNKNLNYVGPEFQVELTINLILNTKSIKEIPIKYYTRIGKSNYTGNFYSSFKVASLMLKVILKKYLEVFFSKLIKHS